MNCVQLKFVPLQRRNTIFLGRRNFNFSLGDNFRKFWDFFFANFYSKYQSKRYICNFGQKLTSTVFYNYFSYVDYFLKVPQRLQSRSHAYSTTGQNDYHNACPIHFCHQPRLATMLFPLHCCLFQFVQFQLLKKLLNVSTFLLLFFFLCANFQLQKIRKN